jgi:WD40 repeat protein
MAPLTELCDGESNSPAQLRRLGRYHPSNVAFSTQAPTLVGSGFGTIAIWDLGKEGEATVRLKFSPAPVYGQCGLRISLSPDDQYIASWFWGVDFSFRVWDVGTGQECRRFVGHGKSPECVVWSRDSQHLLSGDMESSVCLWNMHEEVCACLCVLVYHASVCVWTTHEALSRV